MNAASRASAHAIAISRFTSLHAASFVGEATFATLAAFAAFLGQFRTYAVEGLTAKGTEGDYQKPADLGLFAPATFSDGRRSNATLAAASLVTRDYDGGCRIEEVEAALRAARIAAVIAPSFNHRPDRHKFRAFIVPERPLNVAEHGAAMRYLDTLLPAADQNAKDASRCFYEPAVVAGREADYKVIVVEGAPLPVQAVVASVPDAPHISAIAIDTTHPEYGERIAYAHDYLRAEPGCIQGQPVEGMSSQDRIFKNIAKTLVVGLELSTADAVRVFNDSGYNAKCEPPWADHELAHNFDNARKHPDNLLAHGYLSRWARKFYFGDVRTDAANDTTGPPPEDPPPAGGATATLDRLEQLRQAPANTATDGDTFPLGSLDLSQDPPPVEWSVTSVFTRDSVNLLVAAPGSLKTWTMYSLGIALATGRPWLGKFATTKCNVLLVDWEMGPSKATRRLRKLIKGASATPNIHYLRAPGNMQDPGFWAKLKRTIAAHKIGAVLIDSLAAGSAGVDENTTAFARPLTEAAQIDDVTFVFIHHAGKTERKQNAIARGSSAIQAGADTIYNFSDPQGTRQTDLTAKMLLAKADDGEQEQCIALRLTAEDSLELDGVADARAAESGKYITDVLKGYERDGRRRNLTASAIQNVVQRKKQTVLSDIKELCAAGQLVRIGNGYQRDSDTARYQRVLVAMADGHHTRSILKDQAHVTPQHLAEMVNKGWLVRLSASEFMPPTSFPLTEPLDLTADERKKVQGIIPLPPVDDQRTFYGDPVDPNDPRRRREIDGGETIRIDGLRQ